MRSPRMFEPNGEPTNTQRSLRVIANETAGIVPRDVPPAGGGFPVFKIRTYIVGSLVAAKWIEERKTGPRGGRRLFITEEGQHVLDLIDKDGMHYVRSLWLSYPDMLNEMKRLGIKPEESF